MTDTTSIDSPAVETYPWDAPFVPSAMVSLIVTEGTEIGTFDHEGSSGNRVTGIHVGGQSLTLHVGLSGGDAETIEVAGRLIKALALVQDNAIRRLADKPAEAVA